MMSSYNPSKSMYNGFVISLRLLHCLQRTSAIIVMILIFISITISVTANFASEAKAGVGTKATCGSNSISGVSPVASAKTKERRLNTTIIGTNNQTLHANTKTHNGLKNSRKLMDAVKTNSRSFPTTKKRSVRTSTILRLQKEWQQMIMSGVAYDWINQKPIQKRKSIKSIADDDHQAPQPCLKSHIWIGPISKHQWYIWHFTFTCHDVGNIDDNPYYNGVYHGRIVLSKEYPLRPPISIQLYTPNGRFVANQNICFTSITHYHPDQWNTNSNIYSMIESLRYHMVTSKHGNEIGAVSYASHEQKQLHAINSQSFRKLIPVQYRPSSRLQTKSTIHTNRNIVIIDHANMIRKGYIAVPNLVVANVFKNNHTSTANPNMQSNDSVDQSGASLSTNATFTTVSRIDRSVTPTKRKKTTTKAKMKLKKIALTKIMARKDLGRRQWKLLRHYFHCGVCLFAVLIFSLPLLHPMLKICLMVTSMTLLRNALQVASL